MKIQESLELRRREEAGNGPESKKALETSETPLTSASLFEEKSGRRITFTDEPPFLNFMHTLQLLASGTLSATEYEAIAKAAGFRRYQGN